MNYQTKEEIKKKILTATIGSLARFEEYFGYLWGHDQEDITPEQEHMLDLWEQVRHEILNLGNKQIRSLDSLVVPFKEHYKYNFPVRYKNGDQNES